MKKKTVTTTASAARAGDRRIWQNAARHRGHRREVQIDDEPQPDEIDQLHRRPPDRLKAR